MLKIWLITRNSFIAERATPSVKIAEYCSEEDWAEKMLASIKYDDTADPAGKYVGGATVWSNNTLTYFNDDEYDTLMDGRRDDEENEGI